MAASYFTKVLTKTKIKSPWSGEEYRVVRDSSENGSTDGLMEKEEDFDLAFQRPKSNTFLRKYGGFMILQCVLIALYTLGGYFLFSGPLSRFRGQPLSHCKFLEPRHIRLW